MQREERDRELFNQIVVRYGAKDMVPSSAFPRKKLLLSALRPLFRETKDLGVLVDVGCGIGAVAHHLRGHYRRYIGIDQSEKMIEAARLFNKHIPEAEFLPANIKDAPIGQNSADTILINGALHHMTELDMVLRSLQTIAREGCLILAIEPQNGNPVIQFMRWVRGKIDKSYSAEQVFFSEDELVELFFRNGISNISVDYIGFLSPPCAQVIMNPQFVFSPLCRVAACMDSWFAIHLPRFLKRLSFNIAVSGRFDSK